ncbi:m-AAA protease-interacting protein 1, mitochondrial [Calliphora vicina]|uniref:m-AAA protease-interacting protein 1, mitochondrial n=1 Tax=Calliphora vicina TaxID=7373 RepID=UPI00325B8096
MNIPIRNLKIIRGIYKTNLTLQQCAVKGLKSLSCQQQDKINNWQVNNKNNNTYYKTSATAATNILGKLWNLEKHSQIRGYANFSPKPAEREDNLKKKAGNEKDEDEDNKQMPDHGHGRTLPRLMNFPEIMWPSMLNSIKNWIKVQFIIRPYIDREFNIRDFCQGAKKAMQVVSSKLMNGDFTTLNDLVSSEALSELKPVVQKLSVSQRRQLEVKESDIYLTFPYQIGIIFDETNEKVQKRWVEVTMVFHVLRGLQEMRESGEEIPWNMGTLPEYQDKVFVCNYRFIKEFTTGQESDWTINVVNHFKPIDLINELKREE